MKVCTLAASPVTPLTATHSERKVDAELDSARAHLDSATAKGGGLGW